MQLVGSVRARVAFSGCSVTDAWVIEVSVGCHAGCGKRWTGVSALVTQCHPVSRCRGTKGQALPVQ